MKPVFQILKPCHRIVAKNMELAGYAWGLERKRKLLQLEGAIKQFSLFD
ncbi:MAG: MGMT family protein [Bacteroidetes bacterium]|nr:MGMT family protein [Bacteroidota bacterium]